MAGPLKRQRLSISNRVCMLSRSYKGADEGVGVDECNLYFLDLESSGGGGNICDTSPISVAGFPYILPSLRFDLSTRPLTFCLLGSTLYIFDGFQYPIIENQYQGKSAFKLDLCQTFPPSHKVEDSELESHKVRDMHTSKLYPQAVPTPDGKKILVFSTRFFGVGKEAPDLDFELYDPCADSWEKLPGLSSTFHSLQVEQNDISAFSFINDHLFFIRLSTAMFVLDLELIGWQWIGDVHDGDRLLPWDNGYFPTINGEFVFTCSRIYDAREFGLSREGRDPKPSVIVPQSSFPTTNRKSYLFEMFPNLTSMSILHHDIDRKVVHWCTLNTDNVPSFTTVDRSFTRVLLDGCVTHLSTLDTKIERTLHLLIDHHHCLMDVTLVPTV